MHYQDMCKHLLRHTHTCVRMRPEEFYKGSVTKYQKTLSLKNGRPTKEKNIDCI
jgi:hypothetical protein